MAKPIKVGIVGIGRAGWGMHTEELKRKEDHFKIVASCDLIPERNAKMAERFGCKAYSSIEELLADDEVELVDIATRTCDHYRHTLQALEAGKNVLIEKPMSVSFAQAKDMFDHANAPGKPRLFVRQNRRFEAVFNEVLKAVKSGILGEVFEVQISQLGYQRRDDWQTIRKFGGGQMLNWGPHIIDQALCLLGSEPKNIVSDLKQETAGGDCEDHFSIHLVGENGRTVNLWISGATALNQGRRYTAYGDRGAIDCFNNKITLKYINPEQKLPAVISDPETPQDASFGASGTFAAKVEPEWITEEKMITTEDLSVMWDYLYESLRNGVEYPIKPEEVLRTMRVISTAKGEMT